MGGSVHNFGHFKAVLKKKSVLWRFWEIGRLARLESQISDHFSKLLKVRENKVGLDFDFWHSKVPKITIF